MKKYIFLFFFFTFLYADELSETETSVTSSQNSQTTSETENDTKGQDAGQTSQDADTTSENDGFNFSGSWQQSLHPGDSSFQGGTDSGGTHSGGTSDEDGGLISQQWLSVEISPEVVAAKNTIQNVFGPNLDDIRGNYGDIQLLQQNINLVMQPGKQKQEEALRESLYKKTEKMVKGLFTSDDTSQGYPNIIQNIINAYTKENATKKIFSLQSDALFAFTKLANAALRIIKSRLMLINLNNSVDSHAQSFLESQLPLFQGAINECKQKFETAAMLVKKLPVLSKNNYLKIYHLYRVKQADMVVGFTVRLLKKISFIVQFADFLSETETAILSNLDGFMKYYTVCIEFLGQLEESTVALQAINEGSAPTPKQTPTRVTVNLAGYTNTDDIRNMINESIGDLYVYNAKKSEKASDVIQDNKELFKEIEKIGTWYEQASHYFQIANKENKSEAYADRASSFSDALSDIKDGLEYEQNGDLKNAEESLVAAQQEFSDLGISFLAAQMAQKVINIRVAVQKFAMKTTAQYYAPPLRAYVRYITDQTKTFSKSLYDIFYGQKKQQTDGSNLSSSDQDQEDVGIVSILNSTIQVYTTALSIASLAKGGDDSKTIGTSLAILNHLFVGIELLFRIQSTQSIDSLMQNRYQYINAYLQFDRAQQLYDTLNDTQKEYVGIYHLFDKNNSIKNFKDLLRIRWSAYYDSGAYEAYEQKDFLVSVLYYQHAYELAKNFKFQSFVNALKSGVSYFKSDLSDITSYAQTPKVEARKPYQNLLYEDVSTRTYDESQLFYRVAYALGAPGALDNYVSVMQSYSKWCGKNIIQDQFPAWYQARIFAHACSWSALFNYIDYASYVDQCSTFMKQFFQSLQSLKDNITKALFVEKLLSLQKQLKQGCDLFEFLQAEIHEYGDLGSAIHLSLKRDTSAGLLTLSYLIGDDKGSMSVEDPLITLAKDSEKAGDLALGLIRQAFQEDKNYGYDPSKTYKKIDDLYKQAIRYYNQANAHDSVVNVQKKQSRFVACEYFNRVIPVVDDQIASVIADVKKHSSKANIQGFDSALSQTISSSQGTQDPTSSIISSDGSHTSNQDEGGMFQGLHHKDDDWHLDQTSQPQSSDVQNKKYPKKTEPSDVALSFDPTKPLYLCRTYKQSLSDYALNAQSLVGKTTDTVADAIINQVAVPLYRAILVKNQYQPKIGTLDDEVNRYTHMITTCVKNGTKVASSLIKTSLSITKESSGQIFLQGEFVPMSPFPRFSQEANTAFEYYFVAKKLYEVGSAPIQVGFNLFIPGNDREQLEVVDGSLGKVYIANGMQYEAQLNQIIDSKKIKDLDNLSVSKRAKMSLDDYDATFKKIQNGYEWVIAAYESAYGANKSNPDISLILAGFIGQSYEQFAHVGEDFLLGDPFNGSYQSVLDTVKTNYSNAAYYGYGKDVNERVSKIYENAGDVCLLLSKKQKIVQNYPDTSTVELYRYRDAAILYESALNIGDLDQATEARINGKMIYAWYQAGVQNLILFGVNAFKVSADALGDLSVKATKTFKDGLPSYVSQASNTDDFLYGDSKEQTSAVLHQQYEIMKNLLLDGLSYLLTLQGKLKKIVFNKDDESQAPQQGSSKPPDLEDDAEKIIGLFIKEFLDVHLPGTKILYVQLPTAQQRKKGITPNYLKPIKDVMPKNIRLQILLPSTLEQLFAGGFDMMVNQAREQFLGKQENSFANFNKAVNKHSFNNWISQVYLVAAAQYQDAYYPAPESKDAKLNAEESQKALPKQWGNTFSDIEARQEQVLGLGQQYVG